MEIKQTILQPFGGSEQMTGGSIAWTIGRGVIGSPAAELEDLYEFSSIAFTPGEAQGAIGPTLSQAISGAGSPTWATGFITMPTSQGIINWIVPKTGTYEFDVYGAAAGDSVNLGARVLGRITLNRADTIKIAVGQQGQPGSNNTFAGGGGSFVATLENVPLFVAGGGGANNGIFRAESQGGWSISPLGSNGSGGTQSSYSNHTGGPGGGFNEDGVSFAPEARSSGFGGSSFINGAVGGSGDSEVPESVGGFGAGGGGGGFGDGGGGGYVGGNTTSGDSGIGDGGTSYFGIGTTQISNEAGVRSGSGQIIITYV